jgi:hypothetical protein
MWRYPVTIQNKLEVLRKYKNDAIDTMGTYVKLWQSLDYFWHKQSQMQFGCPDTNWAI